VDAYARRELFEETGLELVPTLTSFGTKAWWVFIAEAPPNAQIQLRTCVKITSVFYDRSQKAVELLGKTPVI
jgi:8-oxo-dGTP pyrophosphatase MutT (NUDIX family)